VATGIEASPGSSCLPSVASFLLFLRSDRQSNRWDRESLLFVHAERNLKRENVQTVKTGLFKRCEQLWQPPSRDWWRQSTEYRCSDVASPAKTLKFVFLQNTQQRDLGHARKLSECSRWKRASAFAEARLGCVPSMIDSLEVQVLFTTRWR
jgi:hypothetical protein